MPTAARTRRYLRSVHYDECGSTFSLDATWTVCPADFDCSGAIGIDDIFALLAAYFTDDSRADLDGSGVATIQDVFDFLAAYFAGCD